MTSVLLIDDDAGTLATYRVILRAAGFAVATAETGHDGLALMRQRQFDIVLADLRLPDLSGIGVLRAVREMAIDVPFVIVTGFGSVRSTVEAVQSGASDVVEKPLIDEELVRVVQSALASGRRGRERELALDAPEAHAVARWARAVIAAIPSRMDPRTLEGWGHCVGVAPGTLRNWCRTAGLKAKRSLIFARLLRAVVRCDKDGCRLENCLNVADPRTLLRLRRLGGATSDSGADFSTDVEDFISRQTLIKDAAALSELRRQLTSSIPSDLSS